jgi:hypothetical protein
MRKRAADAQEWLKGWAKEEHLWLKLLESEQHMIGEGDAQAGRPARRRHPGDPGA